MADTHKTAAPNGEMPDFELGACIVMNSPAKGQNALEAMRQLLAEITFVFTESGIQVKQMNTCGSILVIFTLPAEKNQYLIRGFRYEVTVKSEPLVEFFNMQNNLPLTIFYDHSRPEELQLSLNSWKNPMDKSATEIRRTLMVLASEPAEDYQFESHVHYNTLHMDSALLARYLKNMSKQTNGRCQFIFRSEAGVHTLSIKACADIQATEVTMNVDVRNLQPPASPAPSIGGGDGELDEDAEMERQVELAMQNFHTRKRKRGGPFEVGDIEEVEPICQTYDMASLLKIFAAANVSDRVEIRLGRADISLIVTFEFENGSLRYTTAAVDDDDDFYVDEPPVPEYKRTKQ